MSGNPPFFNPKVIRYSPDALSGNVSTRTIMQVDGRLLSEPSALAGNFSQAIPTTFNANASCGGLLPLSPMVHVGVDTSTGAFTDGRLIARASDFNIQASGRLQISPLIVNVPPGLTGGAQNALNKRRQQQYVYSDTGEAVSADDISAHPKPAAGKWMIAGSKVITQNAFKRRQQQRQYVYSGTSEPVSTVLQQTLETTHNGGLYLLPTQLPYKRTKYKNDVGAQLNFLVRSSATSSLIEMHSQTTLLTSAPNSSPPYDGENVHSSSPLMPSDADASAIGASIPQILTTQASSFNGQAGREVQT